MQGPQFFAGFAAQFAVEQPPEVGVDTERFRRPATTVQGPHEQAVPALAQRVPVHQIVQFRGGLGVLAERQIDLQPGFQRGEPLFGQPFALPPHVRARDFGKRFLPPERQRGAQRGPGFSEITGGTGQLRVGDPAFEIAEIGFDPGRELVSTADRGDDLIGRAAAERGAAAESGAKRRHCGSAALPPQSVDEFP